MRSNDRSEALDLVRGLPTSPEDVRALRRAKTAHTLTLDEYLNFLAQLPPPDPHPQRPKRGPRAERPFALG